MKVAFGLTAWVAPKLELIAPFRARHLTPGIRALCPVSRARNPGVLDKDLCSFDLEAYPSEFSRTSPSAAAAPPAAAAANFDR